MLNTSVLPMKVKHVSHMNFKTKTKWQFSEIQSEDHQTDQRMQFFLKPYDPGRSAILSNVHILEHTNMPGIKHKNRQNPC